MMLEIFSLTRFFCKQHTVNFFQTLLQDSPGVGGPDHFRAVDQFLSYIPSVVHDADNVHLLRLVTMEDVRLAV